MITFTKSPLTSLNKNKSIDTSVFNAFIDDNGSRYDKEGRYDTK